MSLRNKITSVQLTDVGRVREHNEDAIGTNPDLGLLVLADGMGGYNAGEVASGIAVRTTLEFVSSACEHADRAALDPGTRMMRQSIILRDAIARANKIIHQTAKSQRQCEGMGTTIVALLFHDNRVSIAHVGDSRIYRLRNGQLSLLTRDDSILNDQIELGLIDAQDAGDSHNRHMVTQALGNHPQVTAHVQEEELCSGDVYLLCTDGLTDLVDEKDIEQIVDALKTNLPLTASHLVQLANDCGGYDNVTIALIRVLDTPPPAIPEKSLLQRLFDWLGL